MTDRAFSPKDSHLYLVFVFHTTSHPSLQGLLAWDLNFRHDPNCLEVPLRFFNSYYCDRDMNPGCLRVMHANHYTNSAIGQIHPPLEEEEDEEDEEDEDEDEEEDEEEDKEYKEDEDDDDEGERKTVGISREACKGYFNVNNFCEDEKP